MNGTRHTALLEDESVRALRVDVREIADHGAKLHKLARPGAELQRQALAAAVLLSAYLDEGERLTLQLQLEQPRVAFSADVHYDGSVRCRMTPPNCRGESHLKGVMLVLKSVVGREVYRGATVVDHASLEAVLQEHLLQSSQVEAVVRIQDGVGAFVEKLPGDEPIPNLEQLVDGFLASPDGDRSELRWTCTCSRQRVLSMLVSLGETEVQSMLDEDGGAVVDCNYCCNQVSITSGDLEMLLIELRAKG